MCNMALGNVWHVPEAQGMYLKQICFYTRHERYFSVKAYISLTHGEMPETRSGLVYLTPKDRSVEITWSQSDMNATNMASSTAHLDIINTSPDPQATNKEQFEYLEKVIFGLTLQVNTYKTETDKKLEKLAETCKSGHDEIDNLRSHVNIDIGQMAIKCEAIENSLDSLESRFHFDPEMTIITQNMPHI